MFWIRFDMNDHGSWPENNQDVWACWDFDGERCHGLLTPFVFQPIEGKKEFYWRGFPNTPVIAWMPLPELRGDDEYVLCDDNSPNFITLAKQWFNNAPSNSMFHDTKGITVRSVGEYLANFYGYTFFKVGSRGSQDNS